MSSLQATEEYSAKSATHPRVSLADIEANIVGKFFLSGADAASQALHSTDDQMEDFHEDQLGLLTICMLVTRNGFVIVGKSAPASPENFDAEKGRTFAYEDAVRQLWPLMGYALREKLANA